MFTWDQTLYPFGSVNPGGSPPLIAGVTGNVPVDGSAPVTYPFPQTLGASPIAIVAQPYPGSSPSNQQISWQLYGVSATQFSIEAYGGNTGASMPFFYLALMSENQNLRGAQIASVPIDGSASVPVTFSSPFIAAVGAVLASPNPTSPTAQEISWQITNVTLAGFDIIGYGGSPNETMPFSYIATGN
jgi:hypothetical protein